MRLKLSFANCQMDLEKWQTQVRSKLLELTYFDDIPKESWELTETTEKEVNGVLRRRHLVRYGDWEPQPIYESLPVSGKLNGITMVAFHGHGDETFCEFYNYLTELPRRGYRFITPILFGHMERQTLPLGKCFPTEYCREWMLDADKLGVSLLAMRLLDSRLAYEFALSLSEVNPEKIGCIGLSMGGELAMYLAAIEPGIKFSISAGFLSTFEGFLMGKYGGKRGCHCYSIRSWPKWFEMPDIVGCIAPRPLLALKGRTDPCFSTEDVEEAVRQVGKIYEACDASENFQYQTYPGEHCLNEDIADEWLRRFLL